MIMPNKFSYFRHNFINRLKCTASVDFFLTKAKNVLWNYIQVNTELNILTEPTYFF